MGRSGALRGRYGRPAAARHAAQAPADVRSSTRRTPSSAYEASVARRARSAASFRRTASSCRRRVCREPQSPSNDVASAAVSRCRTPSGHCSTRIVSPQAGHVAIASGSSRMMTRQAGQSSRSYGCSSAVHAWLGGEAGSTGTLPSGTRVAQDVGVPVGVSGVTAASFGVAMTGTASRAVGSGWSCGVGVGGPAGIGCACERGLRSAAESACGPCRGRVTRLNGPISRPSACPESMAGPVRWRWVRSGAKCFTRPGPSDGPVGGAFDR